MKEVNTSNDVTAVITVFLCHQRSDRALRNIKIFLWKFGLSLTLLGLFVCETFSRRQSQILTCFLDNIYPRSTQWIHFCPGHESSAQIFGSVYLISNILTDKVWYWRQLTPENNKQTFVHMTVISVKWIILFLIICWKSYTGLAVSELRIVQILKHAVKQK